MEHKNEVYNQHFWSITFTLVYVLFFVAGVYILYAVNGTLPREIALFDLILVILAAFRLTRLFVYDHIAQFFRDFFLDISEHTTPEGTVLIDRAVPRTGPRRTVIELLRCPWCFGMWAGLIVPFFYFLTPLAWFFILALAISGVASFIQILANMIGWNAEYRKRKTTIDTDSSSM